MIRLHVVVPAAYVAYARLRFGGQRGFLADIERRVQTLGYPKPELSMQDPTANRLVTVLVESAPKSSSTDGIISVSKTESVEAPSQALVSLQTADGTTYDPGLTNDEVRAVQRALTIETDPRHLTGFAGTLEPWFPVAASRLRIRSAMLEPGAEAKAESGRACNPAVLRQHSTAFGAWVKKMGYPEDVLRDEVRRAVCSIVQRSPYLNPLDGLEDVPAVVSNLAWCVLRVAASRRVDPSGGRETLRDVDGAALRQALPPTGEEGFVSPSALKLAQGIMKPQMAGVVRSARVQNLYAQLTEANSGSGDTIETMRAQSMLEKALRTLERQRWVTWYSRN